MCKKINIYFILFFLKRIVEFVTFLPLGNEREPTAKKQKILKKKKKEAAAAAASWAICYPLIYARGLNLLHNSSSSFLPSPTWMLHGVSAAEKNKTRNIRKQQNVCQWTCYTQIKSKKRKKKEKERKRETPWPLCLLSLLVVGDVEPWTGKTRVRDFGA